MTNLYENTFEEIADARRWIATETAYLPAKTIWATMMGVSPPSSRHPEEVRELGNCVDLLEVIPFWKRRIGELASVSPEWRTLADSWETITASKDKYPLLHEVLKTPVEKPGDMSNEDSMMRSLKRLFPAPAPEWKLVYAREAEKSRRARIDGWVVGGDTGASSLTIWAWMIGCPREEADHPHDPADLGRCLRLLELIPEWKERLPELAAGSPQWKGLVDRWTELHESMDGEVGIDWSKGDKAERTYAIMKEILR